MICHIRTDNGIPIYEQICRQVKFAIDNGSLAYRDLQNEGVLYSIGGTGLVVATEAPEVCRGSRLQMIRERLKSVLAEAKQNRIALKEVRKLVDEEWKLAEDAEPPPAD